MIKINLLILISFLIFSCGKDDSTSTTPTDKSYITFKANGIKVTLDYFTVPGFRTESIIDNNNLFINGFKINPTGLFSLTMTDAPAVAISTIIGIGNNASLSYIPDDSKPNNIFKINRFESGSNGTFIITKVKSISPTLFAINGTFSGTALNATGEKIIFTEGEFYDIRTK